MLPFIIIIGVTLLAFVLWFWHHQRRLRMRAYLMREAIRNHDFMFRLPMSRVFFGEQALQDTLNALGRDIAQLVAQNEVESWRRLTRVLTHEIMNATTPISSITQAYLSNPAIKGTPYEEGMRAIHDTSAGLNTFVDSYRKLTALQQPMPTDVEMGPFVLTLSNLYPDMEWRVNLPAGLIVHTDENMLRQVIINLVKNAHEAGATMIDIRCHDKALWVSNNGQPIPPEVAREIFVPFFTTKGSGSGIGLSLSRQLMVTQKGNLSLADRPVSGCHVSFVIYL